MIPNRTLIGNRGSGKSVSLEVMMTEVADEAAIRLIDWPGTLSDRMTGRMCERGQEARLIVDKAEWMDRMPQWPFRPESRAREPRTRRLAEDAATEQVLEGLFARRHQKDGTLAPNTYRAARAAIEVFYGTTKSDRPTVNYIAHRFRSRDPIGQGMLAATANQEAARFFLVAARLAIRSPQQWEYLVGAGGRLLDGLFASPAIWARGGTSLDWQAVIRHRRHHYLGREGLSPTAAASLAILTYTLAIQAAKVLAEETGKSHPLVVVLQEAGALSLVTPIITTATQAYRRYGVAIWVAAQTIQHFRDEETFERLLAMSEHYWHQMASGVERAAADCAAPTYDPHRVLHARERRSVVGYERTSTRSMSTDERGKIRTISTGTAFRPVMRTHVEQTYDNPANHEAELRRRLSTLRVGERFFRGLDGTVRREMVPLPADPWGPFTDEVIALFGKTQTLARHRLEAAHRRLRSSPPQPSPIRMDSAIFAHTIRAHTNPASTNRRGAERDASLVRLAQIGPLWISVLLQFGLFRAPGPSNGGSGSLRKLGSCATRGASRSAGTRRSTSGATRGSASGCSATSWT